MQGPTRFHPPTRVGVVLYISRKVRNPKSKKPFGARNERRLNQSQIQNPKSKITTAVGFWFRAFVRVSWCFGPSYFQGLELQPPFAPVKLSQGSFFQVRISNATAGSHTVSSQFTYQCLANVSSLFSIIYFFKESCMNHACIC